MWTCVPAVTCGLAPSRLDHVDVLGRLAAQARLTTREAGPESWRTWVEAFCMGFIFCVPQIGVMTLAAS